MPTERQEVALLRILITSGEKALEAFEASANPVDEEFVTDLARIVQRSRVELAVLVERIGRTAPDIPDPS